MQINYKKLALSLILILFAVVAMVNGDFVASLAVLLLILIVIPWKNTLQGNMRDGY